MYNIVFPLIIFTLSILFGIYFPRILIDFFGRYKKLNAIFFRNFFFLYIFLYLLIFGTALFLYFNSIDMYELIFFLIAFGVLVTVFISSIIYIAWRWTKSDS